ncbi:MAG: PolC-type DNA polymerase III, partial [Clostridiales bacterium]|nr:PolC-type DNA polymerase III [Clostridiales bacterium]
DARYTKDLSAAVSGLRQIPAPEKRTDTAPVKRVELHCHSKMSEKDAVINVADLVEEASRLGHRACALTDHGVVQGFPEAAEAVARIRSLNPDRDFKMIYGMEGYLVDDGPAPVFIPDGRITTVSSFVVLRVETTGADPRVDRISGVHAARFKRNGDDLYACVDVFSEASLQDPTTTGENKKEAEDGSDIFPMLGRVADFIGNDAVCGNDIVHSIAFLRYAGFDVDIEKHDRYRIKFNPVAVELKTIAEWLREQEIDPDAFDSVSDLLPEHVDLDPELFRSAKILGGTLRLFAKENLSELNDKAGKTPDSQLLSRKQTVYHIILLAQNTLGLYHLYRLVSESHLKYYSHRPRISKSLLNYYRDGLIVGSACERGEVFGMARTHYTMNNSDLDKARISLTANPSFLRISKLYDYFEVQPITNNSFYLRDPETGIKSSEDLRNLNRLIVSAGECLGKMVCATTDAHFLEKEDGEFRKYLLMDMEYKDAQDQADLYFRTTREMLDEFSYMGEEKAEEIVITNTNIIADRIDHDIKPFPHGTFPPIIDTAADEIRSVTREAVTSLYTFRGKVAPIVEERVRKELESIIGNGFAIMYYIAYMLVKKSNEDGYIVGSRGSVGSSLVATLCGISEVNPLPPHYRCPLCAYSEFDTSGRYGSGYDLPPKNCPHCETNMIRDGQEIPFETFLGFYGDKQPDIDLNFSSEYQSRAHRFVEELFGTSHTFRAGTIGCFAEKNAIAVVSKICEQTEKRINRAELRRRSRGLIGVKRTTGQHPGGIVVVPREMDVYEFTPIQYPANRKSSGVITTHFDFNAMHDTILKLDILGHYDPTVLRMLGDLTGVDVRTIPIPDPKVMSLFSSSEALGIRDKSYENKAATLGLSEMGTFMARDMIAETRPATFFELVQLMGLSHGTDVWKGNAQDLIRNQTCTLKNVIGCRDSIMTVLIQRGISNKEAFDIMERVRKGKGLKPDQEEKMREHKVPEWYIESCKKIKYMFPKAHAAAYAISSLRIAWFKVYYPEEYYCAFFSIRADEFDGDTMCRGVEIAKSRRKAIHEGFSTRKQTEKAQYYLYELIEEMTARGIEFVPFDLERSEAERFIKVAPGKILPPINAITSVSTAMARAICAARDEKPFATREEVLIRSGIGPSALEKLAASGILDHLPESVQIDLFSLL